MSFLSHYFFIITNNSKDYCNNHILFYFKQGTFLTLKTIFYIDIIISDEF